jgi:hypothetical protein
MAVSREKVMAYVDAELSAEEERKIAQEIAADPALNSWVNEQRALRARLAADFAPVLAAPVPERFERLILDVPARRKKLEFAGVFRRFWPIRPGARSWIPAGAVAAGIAIGIGISGFFGSETLLQNHGGRLVAAGDLARALSTQLAANQNPSAPLRVVVSFVNKAGAYCRSFQTSEAGNGLAGVACRGDGEWRIIATAATEPAAPGQFRQAAASLPDSLRAVINDTISGSPLNAEAQRAAAARGWAR